MTLVHPSYSVLVAIGLVGFLLVRALLDRRHDVRHIGAALAAIVVPAGLVVAVAPADRPRDRLAQPVRGRAEPRLRRLRERARRLRPAQLPARARALRPRGRDRGRLAAAAAAGRLRPPAAVGRVRARRDARDLRGHAAAVRLPALRRRDLDLAGAADHRLLAAAVRARRRRARARRLPAPGGAAGGARGRDRAAAGLPGRLRRRPTASCTARRAG